MKCVCGYEYDVYWNGKTGKEFEEIVRVGDEKFIDIKGTFYHEAEYRYESNDKYSLYICPKCGTIRAEKAW